MTPVFLNPPPSSPFPDLHHVEKKEDPQLNLFINSQYYDEASSSLSSPTFLINSPDQDQKGGDVIIGSQKREDQKGVNNIDVFTSSQNLSICQRDHHHGDVDINGEDHMSSSSTNDKNGLPVKQYWMSSKMRLMQKMSNPETPAAAAHKLQNSPRQDKGAGEPLIFSFSQRDSTSGALIRVCSDCNTTTTPLWRSGPRGPKSLCNACGIRQRKARRAMAEAAAAAAAAANGLVVTSSTTATPSYYKSQYHINKEMKKSRPQYKNKLKLKLKLMDSSTSTTNTTTSPKSEIRNTNNNDNNNNNKLCLRKFSFDLNDNHCSSAFSGVFPNDVAEAAVLLMELSCGFVHS